LHRQTHFHPFGDNPVAIDQLKGCGVKVDEMVEFIVEICCTEAYPPLPPELGGAGIDTPARFGDKIRIAKRLWKAQRKKTGQLKPFAPVDP